MARRPIGDSRSQAEAAFKTATTRPPEQPAAAAVRSGREGNGVAAHRPRCARFLSGRGPRLAGADQRRAAQGGGEVRVGRPAHCAAAS